MRCVPNTQNSPCGYIPDGSGSIGSNVPEAGSAVAVGTYKKGKKCNRCAKICKKIAKMCCTCIGVLLGSAVGSIVGTMIILAATTVG